MKINNKEYTQIKLLGKGKGGYSYLVKDEKNSYFVAKKIHHEPCDYYQFANKLQSEINDYHRLVNLITIPLLIEVDYENEIILKEYIAGETIKELIDNNIDVSRYINIVENYAKICKDNNLNIDYYPTNFIYADDKLYYIDYECNEYTDEWNLENWGIKYWRK